MYSLFLLNSKYDESPKIPRKVTSLPAIIQEVETKLSARSKVPITRDDSRSHTESPPSSHGNSHFHSGDVEPVEPGPDRLQLRCTKSLHVTAQLRRDL